MAQSDRRCPCRVAAAVPSCTWRGGNGGAAAGLFPLIVSLVGGEGMRRTGHWKLLAEQVDKTWGVERSGQQECIENIMESRLFVIYA